MASTVEIKIPELCYAYLILITSFLNPLDCINMILNELVNVEHAVLPVTVNAFYACRNSNTWISSHNI